ncbi:MAG: hypothetical protein H0U52_15780 [Chloroflexi bacterium]|nr:hypothetical protein [Chloroflexota bacterium]
MDPYIAGERALAGASPDAALEAIEFVRFCHRRRRVGWPELYDEMCAVAGRGLYRGYGQDDLAAIGVGFGLFSMPALAGLVAKVVEEDLERRRRTAAAVQASLVLDDVSLEAMAPHEGPRAVAPTRERSEATELASTEPGLIRSAVSAGV